MLSDQDARLQARKRFAKRAAMAPTKEGLRKRSNCGLRCAGSGPPNKYQEDYRGKQQGVTRRRGGSEAPLGRYRTTLTGRSSLEASLALRSVSLKVNWGLGLNGMNWDALDGRTSSTNRAFASDRTIKISASIATTFWIRTAEQRSRHGCPSEKL